MSNKVDSTPLLSRRGPKKRFDKQTRGTVIVVLVRVVVLTLVVVDVVTDVVVVDVEHSASVK